MASPVDIAVDKTKLALRDILIYTTGSRGDVQPFIALAIGLKNAGYNVAIATNINNQDFIEEMGVKFLEAYADVDFVLKNNKLVNEAMAKGDTFKFIAACTDITEEYKVLQSEKFVKCMEAFKHDLFINGSLADYFAAIAKYKLRKPVVSFKLQLNSYDPKRMQLGLPTLPFGLHKYLLYYGILGAAYDGAFKTQDEEHKRQHGYGMMDVYSKKMFIDDAVRNPDTPTYILQSTAFEKVLHPGKHPNFQLVGQCVIPSQAQQKAPGSFGTTSEIAKFLAAGSKPIYCGWGSMTCRSSEFMVELVVRALMHSNKRAIVLGGWAQLSMECLRRGTEDQSVLAYAEENVLFVGKAPHEWLFPQVACTVHHGGAGTLAAAVRGGVPTIITPVWLDQWDHAYLVNELGIGVGMGTQFQKTTAQELGDVIKRVVESQAMADKAKELGEVVRQEDGVKNAVRSVEEFWADWVQSGKSDALVAASLKKASSPQVSCMSGICGR